MPLPGYSPDLMPVEALWRWLREDVTYHHCHACAEDLTRRVADFEVRLNRDPFVIADRLWVKDRLDPDEEKLRFSNQTWFRPPSRPDLRRCARTPARRPCGRGHPTLGRDASQMPSRRPRTSCARPSSRRPPCCRSRRDADRSLYWRSRAQTPPGASTAATRRGTCPPPRCSKHRR